MINRISQIYADRQGRRRRSEDDVSSSSVSISKENFDENSTNGSVTVEGASSAEGTPDFDPGERLGLFGILHYTMNSRFHKVMLIGLVNVILIVTFFLFMFFFVVRVKCGEQVVYVTTVSPTITTTTTRAPSTRPPVNLECPGGYTLMDTVCWKKQDTLMSSADARKQCNLEAAILFELKSEKQNQAFLNFINNQFNKIWLGITCTGSDLTTCIQDDKLVWPFPYSSFAQGSPSGGCLYYDTTVDTNVAWTSGDCGVEMASVCQVTPTVTEGTCSSSYGNYCYYYYSNPMTFSGAQDYCKQHCGNLPSIGSIAENQFIQSLEEIKNEWIWLGGLVASKDLIMWADGGSLDYSNLQEYDAKESCLMLKTKSGNWSSVSCSAEVPFVCKVAKG